MLRDFRRCIGVEKVCISLAEILDVGVVDFVCTKHRKVAVLQPFKVLGESCVSCGVFSDGKWARDVKFIGVGAVWSKKFARSV